MTFIFPQNYKYKYKFFGFLDTQTIAVNMIWALVIFFIVKNLPLKILFKIYFFIIFYFPLFLFSFIGFNGEKFLYVVKYVYKFNKNRKIYLYIK